jgi:hypothetical protein
MWITFSLFLQYSYVSASVQCENCSHNDKSFSAIPNMSVSVGPKWFKLWPPYNLGSVHTTISDAWIIIHFTIYSNSYKNWLQTTSLSVFIEGFSSLITKHNWRHNRHNHGRLWRKCPPSTPHEALRFTLMLWTNRLQPPELANVIWGVVEGVYGPQSAPLFRQWWIATTSHQSILRTIHTLNSPINYIRLLGGCCLSIHCASAEGKASCGALGGTRGPFLLVVVMVGYGCVGWCWLLEANVRLIYCRNSKVCLRKFF